MQPVASPIPIGSQQIVGSLDDSRTASWLHVPYSNEIWIVSNTHDPTRRFDLAFRYPLAHGVCLTKSPKLYGTVKEFAFWLRSPIFHEVDDAATQISLVQGLMHVAHALSLRGIFTFSDVTPYELESIVDDCRYGVDCLLKASDRIQQYFERLLAAGELPPRYRTPTTGHVHPYIDTRRVLAACNLPDWTKNPRIAWALTTGAKKAGLQTVRRSLKGTEDIPALRNLTSQGLMRFLDPIQSLFIMRRKIAADALQFKPFPQGAATLAKQIGIPTERTPTPPPRLALKLLDGAARWVADYSSRLLKTLKQVRSVDASPAERARQLSAIERRLPQTGPRDSPWPLVLRGRQRQGEYTFNDAIKHLATACFALIATFSARRYEEVLALTDDCLRGNDTDGWWLHVYVEKTLQRKDWIPVPNIVARAIEVLLALSKEAREQTGTHTIFQWLTPFTATNEGAVYQLDPALSLDEFARMAGAARHWPKGEPRSIEWHWHPHQFRRFFAILYYYRFEGDIESLSHHLRHFNLEMTRRYVTEDPEVAALWTDVEWGYMGHLARSIVAGDRAVAGGMGSRLLKTAKRIMDSLRANLQVVTLDRVGAALTLMMKRKGLVLAPKPWVTCTSPRTQAAAKRAKCRANEELTDDVVGPNFANAGPTVCDACPWALLEERRQPFVNRELEHLELVATHNPRADTIFGLLEAARVVELREVRDKRYQQTVVVDRTSPDRDNRRVRS